MFNQFHDLMAGTSLYSDYQDARDGLGTACQTAMEAKVEALESIAKQVDTGRAPGGLLFAFNPLPWPRRVLLEYIPGTGRNGPFIPHLTAQDGTKIAAQVRPPESMATVHKRLAAWVDLPAFGYKVFSEQTDGAPEAAADYRSSISV